MRPDGLVLQRSGEAEHHALVGRNREMIRPEVHQAFGEGPRRQRRALRARQHLGAVMGLIGFAEGVAQGLGVRGRLRGAFALSLTLLFPRRQCGRDDLIRGRQRAGAGRGHGALRLRSQPTARIGCRRVQIARTGAQAEAHDGNFGLQHGNDQRQRERTVDRETPQWGRDYLVMSRSAPWAPASNQCSIKRNEIDGPGGSMQIPLAMSARVNQRASSSS